jgi:hypothetical protein
VDLGKTKSMNEAFVLEVARIAEKIESLFFPSNVQVYFSLIFGDIQYVY